MKYIRWLGVVLLILIMGYLSAVGLFADSSIIGILGLVFIFVAGCAGVGALMPRRWQLSVLCSWGAVLLTILEMSARLGRGPVAGQQPTAQVLLTGLGAAGLALLSGYLGYRLRTRR
jgi:hypothetical protein